jgi:arsenate reductase
MGESERGSGVAGGMSGGMAGLIPITCLRFAKMKNTREIMEKKILFICARNSARSRMAEGYRHAKYRDRYEVFSSGTKKVTRVHPVAIAVMQEIGIDISGYRSKRIDEFFGIGTVVTR